MPCSLAYLLATSAELRSYYDAVAAKLLSPAGVEEAVQLGYSAGCLQF